MFDMHWKLPASFYSNQYLSALSVEMKVTMMSETDVSLECEDIGVKPQIN